MRRIDHLITAVRRSTENLEFSEDAGIQDVEIIQYFNDAQDEIQTIIQSLFPDTFQAETEIDAVPGQEAYDIPADAFLNERIEMLEYSRTGVARDYYLLRKGYKRERLNIDRGDPIFYIRRSGQFLAQPAPQSAGTFRLLYQQSRPRLDTRRAKVAAIVLAADSIASLIFDTTEILDRDSLLEDGFITIVDKNGAIKMRFIPITDIDINTGVAAVDSGFTFEPGETISVGEYALRGGWSTTHSRLPMNCEKYLLEYVNTRLATRDSSTDSSELAALLGKIENSIKTAFAEPDGDLNLVPISNTEYLYDGD